MTETTDLLSLLRVNGLTHPVWAPLLNRAANRIRELELQLAAVEAELQRDTEESEHGQTKTH